MDSEEKWAKTYTKLLCANLRCIRLAEQKKPPACWVTPLMGGVAPVQSFVDKHLPAPEAATAVEESPGVFDLAPEDELADVDDLFDDDEAEAGATHVGAAADEEFLDESAEEEPSNRTKPVCVTLDSSPATPAVEYLYGFSTEHGAAWRSLLTKGAAGPKQLTKDIFIPEGPHDEMQGVCARWPDDHVATIADMPIQVWTCRSKPAARILKRPSAKRPAGSEKVEGPVDEYDYIMKHTFDDGAVALLRAKKQAKRTDLWQIAMGDIIALSMARTEGAETMMRGLFEKLKVDPELRMPEKLRKLRDEVKEKEPAKRAKPEQNTAKTEPQSIGSTSKQNIGSTATGTERGSSSNCNLAAPPMEHFDQIMSSLPAWCG